MADGALTVVGAPLDDVAVMVARSDNAWPRTVLLFGGALCVLVAAVVVILVALNSTPIADDIGVIPWIHNASPLSFLHGYWSGLTDRYANAVLLLLTVEAFGVHAVQLTALLLVALMCAFATIAARSAGAGRRVRPGTPLIGCLATVAMIVSAPSLFDTIGWFNAVAIYLAGLTAAVGVGAWMAHLAARVSMPGRKHLLLSLALGGIAAGFTEVVGAVLVLGALLAAVNVAVVESSRERRRRLIGCLGAVAAGAAVGVAVIFVGPGSQLRSQAQQAGVGSARFGLAVVENLGIIHSFFISGGALLAVALGLAFWALRGPVNTLSGVRWLIAWFWFLMWAPLVVVAVMTAYAGSTAPHRTAFIVTASMVASVAVMTYVVAGLAVAARRRLGVLVVPLSLLAMAIGVGGFANSASPVIRAEHLRATLMASRAASIRRQVQFHRTVIWIVPAPLIDPETDAFDLLYAGKPTWSFVVPAIREYYRVPARDAVEIIKLQPRGYCLPNVSVPRFGVRSCQQLARSRSLLAGRMSSGQPNTQFRGTRSG
jgi:hypothetical protein